MPMELRELKIELATFGPTKGQYEGKITFKDESIGMVQINVDHEFCMKVLDLATDTVVRTAEQAAKDIRNSITATLESHNNEKARLPSP